MKGKGKAHEIAPILLRLSDRKDGAHERLVWSSTESLPLMRQHYLYGEPIRS